MVWVATAVNKLDNVMNHKSKCCFSCVRDITNINEMHVRYMEHWLGVPLRLDDVKRAVNHVWPGQTQYDIFTRIVVYARKSVYSASRL